MGLNMNRDTGGPENTEIGNKYVKMVFSNGLNTLGYLLCFHLGIDQEQHFSA